MLGRGSVSINSGGEKIYPEEVEAALKGHPDVFDALVVGVPDPRFGQHVAAVVQPREGARPTLADLDAFVRSEIAGYKVPRSLWYVDEVKRSPAGKPDYRWAKDATEAGPADDVHAKHVLQGGSDLMRTELCDRFGIGTRSSSSPRRRRSPPRSARPAVSGVLGCVRFNDADELEAVLQWMDENIDGKPYGVDIVMPAKVPTEGTRRRHQQADPADRTATSSRKRLPTLAFRRCPRTRSAEGVLGWLHSVARSHVEVALEHPIKLIANALGSPPKDVIDQAHEAGVTVAALAGKAKHAQRHVNNGVDIVIAQGHEAGGHTGEIATMVLVPEVVDALVGARRRCSRPAASAAAARSPRRSRSARRACGWARRCSPPPSTTSARSRRSFGDPGGLLRATSADTVRSPHATPASPRGCSRRVDRRLGRRRRAGAAADAAAEHPPSARRTSG